MAIRFACQCGKQLQAKDEFALRKMRCPACNTILVIPESSEGTAEVIASSVSSETFEAAPSNDQNASETHESVPLMAETDENPIEPVQEKPKAPVTPPAAPPLAKRTKASTTLEEIEDQTFTQVATYMTDGSEGPTDDEAFTKRPSGWLGVFVVALLVFVAAVGTLAFYWPALANNVRNWEKMAAAQVANDNKIEPIDWDSYPHVALLPKSIDGLVSVRGNEWWNSDKGKGLLQSLPGSEQLQFTFENQFGLSTSDIQRVTFITDKMPTKGQVPESFLVLITTSKAYDAVAVRSKLSSDDTTKISETAIFPLKDKENYAVAFPGRSLVLLGSKNKLEEFLQRRPGNPENTMNNAATQAITDDREVVLFMRLTDDLGQQLSEIPLPADFATIKPDPVIHDSLVLAVRHDADFGITMVASCKTIANAQNYAEQWQTARDHAKTTLLPDYAKKLQSEALTVRLPILEKIIAPMLASAAPSPAGGLSLVSATLSLTPETKAALTNELKQSDQALSLKKDLLGLAKSSIESLTINQNNKTVSIQMAVPSTMVDAVHRLLRPMAQTKDN